MLVVLIIRTSNPNKRISSNQDVLGFINDDTFPSYQLTDYVNTSILLDNDIVIQDGEECYIYNSILSFNLTDNGQYIIHVESGGHLYINNSTIKSVDPTLKYVIIADKGSEIRIENTKLIIERNFYRMVFNNPMLYVDVYGKNRYLMSNFLHTWIRVDTFDENGIINGQADLHNTAWGENGSSFAITDAEDSVGGFALIQINSCRKEDEELVAAWQAAIDNKVYIYNGIVHNCHTVSAYLLRYGIND